MERFSDLKRHKKDELIEIIKEQDKLIESMNDFIGPKNKDCLMLFKTSHYRAVFAPYDFSKEILLLKGRYIRYAAQEFEQYLKTVSKQKADSIIANRDNLLYSFNDEETKEIEEYTLKQLKNLVLMRRQNVRSGGR